MRLDDDVMGARAKQQQQQQQLHSGWGIYETEQKLSANRSRFRAQIE